MLTVIVMVLSAVSSSPSTGSLHFALANIGVCGIPVEGNISCIAIRSIEQTGSANSFLGY